MKNIIILLLVLIIFYEDLCTKFFEYFNTVKLKTNIDNNEYQVLSNYKDNQYASDLMGELNLFAINLISKLKEVYLNDSNKYNINEEQFEKGRFITQRLVNNFKSSNLKENEPASPDKTSFIKNKTHISLCLREKGVGNNKLHNKDILKFVFLHELAHMGTIELSHSENFWTNFKFLLQFAKHNNLYIPPDFDKNPVKYCSTSISYNPLNDTNLKNYF